MTFADEPGSKLANLETKLAMLEAKLAAIAFSFTARTEGIPYVILDKNQVGLLEAVAYWRIGVCLC
jgi:hypothetical protein